jgi:transcriptional antiterminator RfaH
MSFWAAAQLQPQRDGLALHCLRQAGFETYAPRLRERRTAHGRALVRTPLLFPGYLFVLIELQWSRARWSPGVVRIVMNGTAPAVVPDSVIGVLRARETGGLIELPRPPKFRPGDRLRVLHGPFAGHVGLYTGMRPRERVEVLLAILGGSQRVTLAADAVEQAPRWLGCGRRWTL